MEEIKNEKPRRISRVIIAAAGLSVLLATVVLIMVFAPVFVPAPAISSDAETSAPEREITAGSSSAETSAADTAPAAGSGLAGISAIEPLLYTKGGSAYMAGGGRTVLLEGAKIIKDGYGRDVINGEFCADKGWLFYTADHNKATGEGDLMRVAAGGLVKPEPVAQGVCDAKVSGDGQRVIYAGGASAGSLYALDMSWKEPKFIAQGVSWYALSANGNRVLYVCGDQDTGDLYSWEFTGEPEFISGGVCSEYCNGASLGHSFDYNIGFSPNAANIYYVAKTTRNISALSVYTLYVKIGGRGPKKVEARMENSLLSGAMFGNGHISDNGQMLYFGGGLVPLPPLYVFYPGGSIERFSGDCIVLAVFGDSSFLVESNGSLYYKAPGQKEQMLSKYARFIPFFGNLYTELPPNAEKRFLMWESSTGLYQGAPEEITLFEQQPGKEKTKLYESETDTAHLAFDPGLTIVACESDGVLYFMQKQNGQWSEPVKVNDTGFAEIHIYKNTFDTSVKYMYYQQRESEDAKSGSLYRFTIDSRESELLMQDVREFYLVEDIPYAITADNVLFRVDTQEQLAQGVQNIAPAQGGIHIFRKPGILYYGRDTDEPITLCEDEGAISAGGITYLPPLTGEVALALEALCADAQRCIDALKAGGTESFWEYEAKADTLNERRDVSAELDGILNKFSSAFGNAGLFAASGQLSPGYKVLGDDTSIKDLEEAIKACREYIG